MSQIEWDGHKSAMSAAECRQWVKQGGAVKEQAYEQRQAAQAAPSGGTYLPADDSAAAELEPRIPQADRMRGASLALITAKRDCEANDMDCSAQDVADLAENNYRTVVHSYTGVTEGGQPFDEMGLPWGSGVAFENFGLQLSIAPTGSRLKAGSS